MLPALRGPVRLHRAPRMARALRALRVRQPARPPSRTDDRTAYHNTTRADRYGLGTPGADGVDDAGAVAVRNHPSIAHRRALPARPFLHIAGVDPRHRQADT